jgi:hypothetical protein
LFALVGLASIMRFRGSSAYQMVQLSLHLCDARQLCLKFFGQLGDLLLHSRDFTGVVHSCGSGGSGGSGRSGGSSGSDGTRGSRFAALSTAT